MTLGAKAKIGKDLLNLLYSNIIIDTNSVAKNLNLTYPRANRIIKDFLSIGILHEMDELKLRNKKYYFKDYLDIFVD